MSTPSSNQSEHHVGAGKGAFTTTHWSVVFRAAQSSQPGAEHALETLCLAYWYPLYAYLRRKGHASVEAEDLIQEFFAERVITRQIFRGIAPERGRFRTWLLNSLQNFVMNQLDRQQARKRGGGRAHVALDLQEAEGHYALEVATGESPDQAYERAWANTMIERALATLRRNYEAAGKSVWFEALKVFLPGALATRPHEEVAARLGKSEDAVKVAVSRLRQEYGRTLLAEIKRTVSSPDEARQELRHLMAALSD